MIHKKYRKILSKYSFNTLLLTTVVVCILLSHSCANQGVGPGGGPKDTIPPVVTFSSPLNGEVNFNLNQVEIAFNEYVVLDNLLAKMVISPPLAQKPTIKTKGKDLLLKFNEDLIPERTYSIDFQDGIKDFNESNKLEDLRLRFSTYETLDTLQISGYLINAFTLDPVENALATLYTIDSDTIFATLRPDFIAKANKKGYFMFDNLPSGSYRLYGLVDSDNNYKYTNVSEQVAFIDSFIVPSAIFIAKIDTLIQNTDTTITSGYTEYFPKPVYQRMFFMDTYSQFLKTFKRTETDKMVLTFNESLTDSFNMELLNYDSIQNWSYFEFDKEKDSINVWITDSVVSQTDSLLFRIKYAALDSVNNAITSIDTLRMVFTPPTNQSKKKKENEVKTTTFQFISNLTAGNFDLNKLITIEAPSPLISFDSTHVKLVEVIDSLSIPVKFKLKPIKDSRRKYTVEFELKENKSYVLSIDSATAYNTLNIPNEMLESKFKTQKADFYGTFNIDIAGIDSSKIIQLLKDSKNEDIEYELVLKNDKHTASFDYLKPGKYKVKLIADLNNNGKWDTGNIDTRTQPEPVYYLPKKIEIRSNWELKESWNIDPKVASQKEIIDSEEK